MRRTSKPGRQTRRPDGPEQPRQKGLASRALGFAGMVLARAVVWLGRGVIVLLIVLVLALAYLHLVGLPPAWLDPLLERAAAEGYHLTVEGVRLHIDRGLVARGVKLYARPDDPVALMTAEAMSATVRPWNLVFRRQVVPVLEVSGGRVTVPLGGADGGKQSLVDVRDVYFRGTMQEGEMVVQKFRAEALGLTAIGRGSIYLGAGEENESEEAIEHPVEVVLEALEQVPELVVKMVETLRSLRFAKSPEATATFSFYPEHPEANAWAVSIEAGKGRADALEWESFDALVRWREGKLTLDRLRLGMGVGGTDGEGEEEVLEESGWFDSASGEAYLQARSTVRPATVAKALPAEWVKLADKWVDSLDFPLLIEATAGPGPAEGLATQVVARVSASGTSARGLAVDKLEVEARLGDGIVEVPAVHVELSEDGIAGQADITEAWFRPETFSYGARLNGQLVPTWPDRFIPEDASGFHNLLGRFVFHAPGKMRLRIEGQSTNVMVRGPCEMTDFELHGVHVDKATALLGYSNDVVRLRRSYVERGEGVARGDVEIDLDRQTVRFAAESTLPLGEAGGVLGPEVGQYLSLFRFEGSTVVKAEGTLDFCSLALNDISGHAVLERAGMGQILADKLEGDVRVKGLAVELSNVEAAIFGGHAAGMARFYPVMSDSNWRYEVAGEVQDLQLADALAAVAPGTTNDLRGNISGPVHVGGYFVEKWGSTMEGAGKLTLKNGWVFQAPLFNGLTSVLQLVVPEVSFFAQTDASASFDIRSGRVRTEDAKIEGSLFSVAGNGSYGLDDQTLDFDVQVQLMRGGVIARIVRFVTSPLTRLLKFTLSGTVDDASWHPTNLNPMKLVKLAADGASSLAGVVLGIDEEDEAEGAKRPKRPLPVPKSPVESVTPPPEAAAE
ncbi:MAG: hypothetical protein IJT88_01535 [Kiritimatiellae bacterium]|nr:hypothetical protein [Kiritimatiellia bacterium]